MILAAPENAASGFPTTIGLPVDVLNKSFRGMPEFYLSVLDNFFGPSGKMGLNSNRGLKGGLKNLLNHGYLGPEVGGNTMLGRPPTGQNPRVTFNNFGSVTMGGSGDTSAFTRGLATALR